MIFILLPLGEDWYYISIQVV